MRPHRAAGQNFLINTGTLQCIVDAVHPQPEDTILEIGAGFGVLTEALAPAAGRVVAVERDHRIVPLLRERIAQYANVIVVEADILDILSSPHTPPHVVISSDAIPPPVISSDAASEKSHTPHTTLRFLLSQHNIGTRKIVANLPYSITSDFLRVLFDRVADGTLSPPERVVLLLQYEVVERLIGRTERQRGLPTMLTELACGSIRRVARVPGTHFWPAPKVQSAVAVFSAWRSPEEIAALVESGREHLIAVMKQGFAHPRRQLVNTLHGTSDAVWTRAGVAPSSRPAMLTLHQWIALANAIAAP
ncbi:MAG: rRNA adenine dimethyltransferase family protein [bacterium]|nr:rRNA adenine dimethyltransferase family protein [bacterium]